MYFLKTKIQVSSSTKKGEVENKHMKIKHVNSQKREMIDIWFSRIAKKYGHNL